MKSERMEFLARLPLLLNSAMSEKQVIELALEYLSKELQAERATVFLLRADENELEFWALDHLCRNSLRSQRMPASAGIVGTVIRTRKAEIVDDAQNDPRFYKGIDQETGFVTRNILCLPLIIHGKEKLGAIQVLNKTSGPFTEVDLDFAKLFADHVAIAIHNNQLVNRLQSSVESLEISADKVKQTFNFISRSLIEPIANLELLLNTNSPIQNSQTELAQEALLDLLTIQCELHSACQIMPTALSLKRTSVTINPILRRTCQYIQGKLSGKNIELILEAPHKEIVAKVSVNHIESALRIVADYTIDNSLEHSTITFGASFHEGIVRLYFISSSGQRQEENSCESPMLRSANFIAQAHGSEIDLIHHTGGETTISILLPGEDLTSSNHKNVKL